MTDGERLLWQRLRGEQIGVKFRRQHPVGPYVADFACLAPQLIVEVDGSQHINQQAYDTKRDAYFKSLGFDVLRFPADLPFSDLTSMVEAIYNRVAELAAAAPSPPSPKGGRSKSIHDDQAVPSLLRFLPLPPLGEGRDGGHPGHDPNLATPSSAASPHPNLPPEGEGA
jgi:very-short-patch-repair endonuclease